MTKNRKAPQIKDAINYNLTLPAYDRHVLSNGVEVYIINCGSVDAMRVNWIFNAGVRWQKKKGVAYAANSLLLSGTAGREAADISEFFEFYGAGIDLDLSDTVAFITLECLTRHSKDLLPGVAEIICNSTYPDAELQILKDDALQVLTERNNDKNAVADLLLQKVLYGQMHPFAMEPTPEDYLALNRQDLLSFHQDKYAYGECFITVSGKLPVDLVDQLEDIFGTLPLNKFSFDQEYLFPPLRPSEDRIHHKAIDRDKAQTSIRVGKSIALKRKEDYGKLKVLSFILGGYPGSRLYNNIREDKGYVYSIECNLVERGLYTQLTISADTDEENSLNAVNEIRKELGRLSKKVIKGTDLRTAKNLLIGSLLDGLQNAFNVASFWEYSLLKGYDDNYFYQLIDIIKNVTADELLKFAQEYLSAEDFYVVTVA